MVARAAQSWDASQANQTFTVEPLDQLIVATARNTWGATGAVSKDTALQVPAVLRGRNLICGISTLPLVTVGDDRVPVRTPLLQQIDSQTPNLVTLAQTVEDLLFHGIAWWQIRSYGWDGFPSEARHVDQDKVSLKPPPGASLQTLPSGIDPTSAVWVEGKPVNGKDMIRFDSPQPPLLVAARRAIRRAALLEQAAELYADGGHPLDYFSPTEGADPADDTVIQAVLDTWQASRKDRSTAYVPAALDYHQVSLMSPADLQLVGLQQRAALDIANAIGLDPEDLGISTTSRTYQNATDRRRDRINDVLAVYMGAVTDRLSMNDITKRGLRVRFDLTEYLRADPKTRAEVAAIYHGLGAVTVDEIRADDGRPDMTPAQKRAATPKPPPAPPAPPAQQEDHPMPDQQQQHAPVSATFARQTMSFEAPEVGETFRVDSEARTITGLAVPYGVAASNGAGTWRFRKGSLKWGDTGRIKLLRDHDHLKAIGRAVKLQNTPDGLVATFKVARGPDGDAALSLAEDGVLDGLSVGVDFTDDSYARGTDGVNDVGKAALREISLTALPAFDDSRVTSVAASDSERDLQMTDVQAEPAVPAAAEPSAPDFSTPIRDAVFEAVKGIPAPSLPEDFGTQLGTALAAGIGAALPPAREVVNPNREGAMFVSEPLPYRFDGVRGEHEFSGDLFKWARTNDSESKTRLDTFMRAVFADVSTDDVNELNPSGYRPDLYVAALEYTTPIWNAIYKGQVGDATPFVVPKFSSSSGLVGDHSESNEPTGGTFVTTSQTITPAPLSGKVEITRETIDQGGNPQVSGLIWNEILRAWNEALEAKAVAVLEALTPTAIALTAGAADDDLEGEITAALAALQFVAGGFRMRDLFVNQSLFTALISAKDSTGRRLFPIVNAQNSTGTTDGDFGVVNIGNIAARPAWALPTSTTAEESSYLFNRSDVHGWASAPRELRFEYEVKSVWLGVWGYAATANTRLAGVRELTYDPTS